MIKLVTFNPATCNLIEIASIFLQIDNFEYKIIAPDSVLTCQCWTTSGQNALRPLQQKLVTAMLLISFLMFAPMRQTSTAPILHV